MILKTSDIKSRPSLYVLKYETTITFGVRFIKISRLNQPSKGYLTTIKDGYLQLALSKQEAIR